MTGVEAAPLVLGLDSGGTHTRGVAMTLDGRVLARSLRQGANPRAVGDAEGRTRLEAAVADLRAQAPGPVLHVAIGLAGLMDSAPDAVAAGWAERLGVPAATVDTDARVAHAAAFGLGPGAIVVAGTGSQCLAIDPEGNRVRVGGWGSTFGDEGSAYWIARTAITSALHALDEGCDDPFTDDLARVAGTSLDAPAADLHDALLRYLYGEAATPDRHAAFALRVAERAEAGAPQAEALLREAGAHLARLARTAATRSHLMEVAYSGSVLSNNAHVRDAFLEACREAELTVRPGRWDPALGAARLARAAVDVGGRAGAGPSGARGG